MSAHFLFRDALLHVGASIVLAALLGACLSFVFRVVRIIGRAFLYTFRIVITFFSLTCLALRRSLRGEQEFPFGAHSCIPCDASFVLVCGFANAARRCLVWYCVLEII